MINRREEEILVNFFVHSNPRLITFTTSSARFSEFYADNVILFQIKVNAKNIKKTTLERYFIKVTTRPGFTRLIH